MAELRPDRWEMGGARFQRLGRVVLPGLYAWLTTAAIPAVERGGALAIAAAGGALVCLVGGVVLLGRRPVYARAVGILGFVGFCLVSWLSASFGGAIRDPDTTRSAVGAVAWGLFSLGWGGLTVSTGPEVPGNAVSTPDPALFPRRSVPKAIVWGWLALCGVALSFPALAWSIDDPVDALLGQVLAATAAIAVLGSGTTVLFGRQRAVAGHRRWRSLALGCLWVVGGVVFDPFGSLGQVAR